MADDGVRLATYDLGEESAPVVLAVHGFASNALLNWHRTGWTRDLTEAGFRVVAVDLRGHGASDKPHRVEAYSMQTLLSDVVTVVDTYLLDEVTYLGYSLGARLGWHAAEFLPHRITRAVVGGIPEGDPMSRVVLAEAREFLETGQPIADPLTKKYLALAADVEGNDLHALVALVAGMRGSIEPTPANAPGQDFLIAAGSHDSLLPGAERLADAAPRGAFVAVAGRSHFSTPGSPDFRRIAIAHLRHAVDVQPH